MKTIHMWTLTMETTEHTGRKRLDSAFRENHSRVLKMYTTLKQASVNDSQPGVHYTLLQTMCLHKSCKQTQSSVVCISVNTSESSQSTLRVSSLSWLCARWQMWDAQYSVLCKSYRTLNGALRMEYTAKRQSVTNSITWNVQGRTLKSDTCTTKFTKLTNFSQKINKLLQLVQKSDRISVITLLLGETLSAPNLSYAIIFLT